MSVQVDQWAEAVGFDTVDPEPRMTTLQVDTAIDDLMEASALLGHIPIEIRGVLRRVIERRDGASAQVARELRGIVT